MKSALLLVLGAWTVVTGLLEQTPARLVEQVADFNLAEKPSEKAVPAASHVSVTIHRSPSEVYEFVSHPENFIPQWATGPNGSVSFAEGAWVANAPIGKVKMRFAERNALGVLDFDLILESGATIHNPMRVIPNGRGSELIRTILREPGMAAEEFAEEIQWAERDLTTIKKLLEQ